MWVGVVDFELNLLLSKIIFKFEFLTQVSPWCASRYALLVEIEWCIFNNSEREKGALQAIARGTFFFKKKEKR